MHQSRASFMGGHSLGLKFELKNPYRLDLSNEGVVLRYSGTLERLPKKWLES
jgi:hypothetical protein